MLLFPTQKTYVYLCLLENLDILAECYYSANLCFEILQVCFWLAGCAGGDQVIGNPIFGKIFTIVKETLKFFAISLLSNGILNIVANVVGEMSWICLI